MSQNFSRFFTEATPIYLLFLMAAWIASIVIRIWRKGGISFVEATAFSFACLTLLAYLRTPGWYRYFFPAQILATLFFSVSVKNIIKNSPIRARFLVRYIAMGMFALLIGLQTYLLFFDSWISQYAESTKTEQWEEYFAEMDPTLTVFVYDMPEAVPFLPVRTTYYQYVAVNAQGYWGLGTNELEVIKKKIPDEILISKDSPALPLAGYYQSNEVAGIAVLMRQAE